MLSIQNKNKLQLCMIHTYLVSQIQNIKNNLNQDIKQEYTMVLISQIGGLIILHQVSQKLQELNKIQQQAGQTFLIICLVFLLWMKQQKWYQNLMYNIKEKEIQMEKLAGILIQAKDSNMYRNLYGMQIGETILQILKNNSLHTIAQAQLKCPIYLHSFDFTTIKYWSANTQLPINYLLTNTMPYNLGQIAKYATGIGYQEKMVWDYFLAQPTWILQQTRKYGLLIHVWTLKDDARIFQAISNIEMYKIGQLDMKLDGIITQNCNSYGVIAPLLKNNKKKQYQEKLFIQQSKIKLYDLILINFLREQIIYFNNLWYLMKNF